MSNDRDDAGVLQERPAFDLRYIATKPDTWTFQPQKVRRFVEGHLEGRVLNLFAGKTKLRHLSEIVRNDLDEKRDADYHFDAVEVRERFGTEAFDTLILDPPFSVQQSRKRYNGEYAGHFKHIRDEAAKVVRPGGKVLTFGYHTTGMGKGRGYQKEELAVLGHGGRFRATLAVVERRVERDLSEFRGGVPADV